MKKTIILMGLFIVVASSTADLVETVCSQESSYRGRRLVAKVLVRDLEKSPKWEDKLADPPLSVKDAVAKAKAYAETYKYDQLRIEIGNIILRKLDSTDYIYIVEIYFMNQSGKGDGFTPPLNVVVLMDGTVIKFKDMGLEKIFDK